MCIRNRKQVCQGLKDLLSSISTGMAAITTSYICSLKNAATCQLGSRYDATAPNRTPRQYQQSARDRCQLRINKGQSADTKSLV